MKRRILTDEEFEQFWTLGYVVVKGALTTEETETARRAIIDMIPRDLNIPDHYASHGGRIKPYHPDKNQSYFTPELLPLLMSENLYKAAADLFDNDFLRVGDGSVGVTLKDTAGPTLSQGLHLDMHKPAEVSDYILRYRVGIGGCYYLTKVEENGAGIHIIPGAPQRIMEQVLNRPEGAPVEFPKNFDDFPPTMEVLGDAGDFVMMHHLMPHAASRNRRSTTRVAQFTRYRYLEREEAATPNRSEADFSPEQLAVMTPLGRKLFGLDPWVR